MKLNSIISRYIFLEMIPPFIINMLFFTFMFLMTRILEITDMIVNYGVNIWTVLKILGFTMPFFLQFIIPMSVMMAVLLTFLKMSTDNEIIALKAGGVSLYRLLPPVFLFALIGVGLTGATAIYGLPTGRVAIKQLLYDVAVNNSEIGLKPRTFNDAFNGVMLYVNKIEPATRTLQDVFIEDQRSPDVVSTVVSPRGRLFSQPETGIFQLRLYNGSINQVDVRDRSAHTVLFETYDIRLDIQKNSGIQVGGPKNQEEMSIPELLDYLQKADRKDDRYYLTLMEFHKKFSLPFSCLFLALLAVPLGIQSRQAKRSFGVGLGLIFFLLYYLMLSAGWVFGETGVYPPLIGMWVPNLVMGGIGLFLLVRNARERPVRVEFLHSVAKGFKKWLPVGRTEGS
ncbi:MAG: LPS export ABC transporter permease LptF [Desulfobacterales bacterium]|nr:LPS export ABC transporter permease LptF [Desulfobacterales bacterium]